MNQQRSFSLSLVEMLAALFACVALLLPFFSLAQEPTPTSLPPIADATSITKDSTQLEQELNILLNDAEGIQQLMMMYLEPLEEWVAWEEVHGADVTDARAALNAAKSKVAYIQMFIPRTAIPQSIAELSAGQSEIDWRSTYREEFTMMQTDFNNALQAMTAVVDIIESHQTNRE